MVRFCGLIWPITLMAVAIFMVAFPWHFVSTSLNSGDCKVVSLFGWKDQYCTTQGGDCPSGVCDGYPKNWRDLCSGNCPETEKAVNVTLAFAFASFVCIMLWGTIKVMKACKDDETSSNFGFMLLFAAVVLLIIAVIYFPARFPAAQKADDPTCDAAGDSSCTKFFGSRDAGAFTLTWGGAGWIVALVLLLVLIVQFVVEWRRRKLT